MNWIRSALCGAVVPLLFCGTAVSEPDQSRHWVQDPDKIVSVDSSDAGKDANFYSFSRIIRTSGGPQPTVLLTCQAMSTGHNSMNFAIQLDPANTYESDPSERLRLLSLSGTLIINGEGKPERFKYHPASSKVIPFDKSAARRLFNAVVKGSEVHLKIKGDTFDLALPGKGPAFVSFAKTCPITNGGTFDQSIFDRFRDQMN